MKKIIIQIFIFIALIEVCWSQTSIPKAQSLFIYNFTRLIEWPQAYKTGNFIVGVLGSSSLSDELKTTLSGKKVSLQDVELVVYHDVNTIERCHILVVPFSKSGSLESIITKIGNQGTLIITEKKGLIEKGSIINFIVDGNALKFELNKEEAQKRGLNVNSSLEKMAVAY